MLLSHTYGYLFIANQKVASESIHLVAGDDADLGLVRIGQNKHANFNNLLKLLDDYNLEIDFSDLFVFSIVREPAEWYVSWYNSRARVPLANPNHRRHAVYTGATEFDEFLKLAQNETPDPMTKVKAQAPFFKRRGKGKVIPVAFPAINDAFSQFSKESSLSGFTLGAPQHHKNKSKIKRISSSDLTKAQRELINTKLFPDDYALFQKALKKAGKSLDIKPDAAAGTKLQQALKADPKLADLAFETAFGFATSQLYSGKDVEAVKSALSGYEHIDTDAIVKDAAMRTTRFQNEAS